MFDPTARPAPSLTANQVDQLADAINLSEESRGCVKRLIEFVEKDGEANAKAYNRVLQSKPTSKLAAVLVLLYEERGRLRVLLTTRSKSLRTHAGQTALPGGRVDLEDRDWVDTALREAKEEVSLPSPTECGHVHILGVLHPFLSLHRLLVVPVVALLTDTSVLKNLRASEKEVACIFSHPLEAILDPAISAEERLVDVGSEDWPYETEFYNTSDSVVTMLGDTSYRMHRFRTSASPIKGLTSDILSTVYERYASDQIRSFVGIVDAVRAFEEKLAASAER
ncbi:NUDIX hydrolase [Coprinopsis cinerea okayama7|uniref:NUDIX hydrolase n=1 Tax=Coprinopsis cinerea (strain Okayama-7 / 130 / ATCC MYA-4618 / FGSC 9003) TaxID=240176 RepID=A8NVN0_COPC7|nr:NUDIX hydrolase [Coprinopsis cinerea okayama7\|eukprot:XP_001836688.2 NUDIX hydrolase [Coprinopsis cinerea okayama7\